MTTQPRCSSHYFYWWKTIGKSFVLLRRNGILGRFFEAVPQHPGTNSQTVCPPSMTTSISKMRRKVRWDSVETFFSSENHRKSLLAYGSCCCVGLFVSWVILHLGPSTHPQEIEASMSSSSVLLSPEDSFVELSPKCTRNLGVFEWQTPDMFWYLE